ncbi:MAG: type II toxin-antitoxin system VapC family toxin [Pseudomonadota bacterium]|nr:type II toxin-antitoxin system VapC family toxin [Pseudomonadota bacterium]
MNFLADTNVLSELVRPRPNPGVLSWADQVRVVHLSAVTVEEILFGLSWKPNAKILAWFEQFLQGHSLLLPVSPQIARHSGELRGRLRAAGQVRTQADMLIAATAAIHNLTVVTRNERDFEGCGVSILNPFLKDG